LGNYFSKKKKKKDLADYRYGEKDKALYMFFFLILDHEVFLIYSFCLSSVILSFVLKEFEFIAIIILKAKNIFCAFVLVIA
jgi:GT2 family glycosyltransferase